MHRANKSSMATIMSNDVNREDSPQIQRTGRRSIQVDTRKNAPWEHYSLDTTERMQEAENIEAAANYKYRTPYTYSTDMLKDVNAENTMNYEFKRPWDYENDLEKELASDLNKKLDAIANYSYEPPWKPLELTEAKKLQLANYQINPPFQTQYTPPIQPPKPAKRLIPG